MFTYLPYEIERHIWLTYFRRHVCVDIRNADSVWVEPSLTLLDMTKDVGCIQSSLYLDQYGQYTLKPTDLERIPARGCRKWYYENLHYFPCLTHPCNGCRILGFPCCNAIKSGNMNEKMMRHWNLFRR